MRGAPRVELSASMRKIGSRNSLLRYFLLVRIRRRESHSVEEGTPQGGLLSPLLSNLAFDELDRELERRGHRFCRHGDDCNIYVRSQRAGECVKRSLTSSWSKRLKLRVNEEKSALARLSERKFLRFSMASGGEIKRSITPKAPARFKQKVQILTGRTRGISIEQMAKELFSHLRGGKGYFGFYRTPSVLEELDQGIRLRLRSVIWRRWNRGSQGYRLLRQRGVSLAPTAMSAGSPHGPWGMSKSPAIHIAFPVSTYSAYQGCLFGSSSIHRTGVCGPACTVVWEGSRGDFHKR
jgi:RNA-directed DNA polymerase